MNDALKIVKRFRTSIFVLVLVLVLATLLGSLYTVHESEQVIITQFGRIISKKPVGPGLHLKVPFIQEVHRFDKRWLEWDGAPNQIPTRDKKYIWVDTYARWRISDPIRYYKRLRNEQGAQSRLDDIIDGEFRNVIASHNLIEIVRTSSRKFKHLEEQVAGLEESENDFGVKLGRDKLARMVLKKASSVMPDYGIELADVQVKRVNYEASVQSKVFERMISERKRIAQRFRSEGQGKSAEISGRIEKELKTIESEAYKTSAEIRGKADAEATTIYAKAYQRDPDFYQFLKTLESYPQLIDKETDLVLSSDSELLKYLRTQK